MKKHIPLVMFGFIMLSVMGVKFPSFISKYLWYIVNGIALFALWPSVKSNW